MKGMFVSINGSERVMKRLLTEQLYVTSCYLSVTTLLPL
jgi:hypothetical protein